jgi:flagellar hook capping protein FlgD
VALLLVATATAMVVTQHLRDEGPVASSIRLKTRPESRYRACFRLTRDDSVQVAIVDYSDRLVRILSPARPLEGSDTPHCFDWDGRNDAGQPVPAGRYHIRLELERADRVAISGERLKITPNQTGSSSASPAEDPRTP